MTTAIAGKVLHRQPGRMFLFEEAAKIYRFIGKQACHAALTIMLQFCPVCIGDQYVKKLATLMLFVSPAWRVKNLLLK
jgi:hypothetical protein